MKSKLTKAEEEVMRYVWELGECTIGNIRDAMAAKYPNKKLAAHSTVSTVLKALRDKEYIGFKSYGRTYVYNPIVSKDEYSRGRLKSLVGRFFGGSPQKMVSFLVEENDLSLEDLEELTRRINDENKGS
ncbi:transcriptional regulator [Lewinellaceae bacterium SD302]|nr:transcriptional regulator [Lewinellaceae bacterium SD302]